MMNIVADLHTHTIASGHAYGTIREMASAAAEKGLLVLGITEHGPGIPGTVDRLYFYNMSVIPRELYGVRMLFGSEVNVLNNGTVYMEQKDLNRLDYAIAGIHTICYENAGVEGNTNNLIACMMNERVFFVSHPDDDHTPLNYERLVPAAKECHVALEVNNSSMLKPEQRLNCVENYRTMLKLCMKYRTNVIVSSDAHDPSAVGRFDEAVALMESCGFDEELILNTSIDKVLDFIGH